MEETKKRRPLIPGKTQELIARREGAMQGGGDARAAAQRRVGEERVSFRTKEERRCCDKTTRSASPTTL